MKKFGFVVTVLLFALIPLMLLSGCAPGADGHGTSATTANTPALSPPPYGVGPIDNADIYLCGSPNSGEHCGLYYGESNSTAGYPDKILGSDNNPLAPDQVAALSWYLMNGCKIFSPSQNTFDDPCAPYVTTVAYLFAHGYQFSPAQQQDITQTIPFITQQDATKQASIGNLWALINLHKAFSELSAATKENPKSFVDGSSMYSSFRELEISSFNTEAAIAGCRAISDFSPSQYEHRTSDGGIDNPIDDCASPLGNVKEEQIPLSLTVRGEIKAVALKAAQGYCEIDVNTFKDQAGSDGPVDYSSGCSEAGGILEDLGYNKLAGKVYQQYCLMFGDGAEIDDSKSVLVSSPDSAGRDVYKPTAENYGQSECNKARKDGYHISDDQENQATDNYVAILNYYSDQTYARKQGVLDQQNAAEQQAQAAEQEREAQEQQQQQQFMNSLSAALAQGAQNLGTTMGQLAAIRSHNPAAVAQAFDMNQPNPPAPAAYAANGGGAPPGNANALSPSTTTVPAALSCISSRQANGDILFTNNCSYAVLMKWGVVGAGDSAITVILQSGQSGNGELPCFGTGCTNHPAETIHYAACPFDNGAGNIVTPAELSGQESDWSPTDDQNYQCLERTGS